MNPYDSVAREFDTARAAFKEKRYLDRLIEGLPRGSRILDLGCGSGQPITQYLDANGFLVTAVDSSREMLRLARTRVPSAQFIRADIEELALERSYDAVVAWDSLFHIKRERQVAVFERCYALLRTAGGFLLSLGGLAWEGTEEMFGQRFFYSGYAPETSVAMLEAVGFRVAFWEVDDPSSRGHIAVLARKDAGE